MSAHTPTPTATCSAAAAPPPPTLTPPPSAPPTPPAFCPDVSDTNNTSSSCHRLPACIAADTTSSDRGTARRLRDVAAAAAATTVEESNYVFESKTIQRMEILILSTLKWKMNPVTPLSFLEYIAKRIKFKSNLCREFFRRFESLVLSVVSDCRFMCYLLSALATAIMVYVISSLEPCIDVEYQDQLLAILGLNYCKYAI